MKRNKSRIICILPNTSKCFFFKSRNQEYICKYHQKFIIIYNKHGITWEEDKTIFKNTNYLTRIELERRLFHDPLTTKKPFIAFVFASSVLMTEARIYFIGPPFFSIFLCLYVFFFICYCLALSTSYHQNSQILNGILSTAKHRKPTFRQM